MFKLIVNGPEGQQVKAFRSFEHAVRWAKQQAEAGRLESGLLLREQERNKPKAAIRKEHGRDRA
jgi:hypothetical protein